MNLPIAKQPVGTAGQGQQAEAHGVQSATASASNPERLSTQAPRVASAPPTSCYGADAILKAIEDEQPSHIFALFSGGHDSLCSTHLASKLPGFSGVIHCNTGIGIEQTREYVRDTCARFDWKLIEKHPDYLTYEDLIFGRKPGEDKPYLPGFPGGARSHMRYYYYLKQRSIDAVVREHKTGPRDRIGLVSGIRADESTRRMMGTFARPAFREGAKLWLNPILDWTHKEKNAYMREHDLPRNIVVDSLERSGECLCGALTAKDEFREIELWYPEAAERIRQLEAEVQAAHPDLKEGCFWGRRGERENPDQLHFLPMCVSCAREAA